MTDRLEEQLRETAAGLASGYDDERLTLRAGAEGLLDVAYTTVDSPLGGLLVAATKRGLVRLSYIDHVGPEAVLAELAQHVSPRILASARPLDEVCRQLGDYLSGARADFDLPLDRALIGPFAQRVLERTAQIPYGATATYGQVANEIGSPRAARATGNALAHNPLPIVIPCHRVVRGGGAVGGYAGGSERKARLLELECGTTEA